MMLQRGDFIKIQRLIRPELGEKSLLCGYEYDTDCYIRAFKDYIEKIKSIDFYNLCFMLEKVDIINYDNNLNIKRETYRKRNPFSNKLIDKVNENYCWVENMKLFNNLKYSIGTFYDIDNEGNFIIKLNGNNELYEAIELENNLDKLAVEMIILGKFSKEHNKIYSIIRIDNSYISYYNDMDKRVLEERNRLDDFKFKGVFKEDDIRKSDNTNV